MESSGLQPEVVNVWTEQASNHQEVQDVSDTPQTSEDTVRSDRLDSNSLWTNADSELDYRKWTSKDGRTTVAAYIGYMDPYLTLKSQKSDKEYPMKISNLSNADRQYVYKRNNLLSPENSELEEDHSDDDLHTSRVWMDDKGTQIKAKFVEYVDGRVHLRSDKTGKTYKMDMARLSKDDQDILAVNLPEAYLYLKAIELETANKE